MTGITELLPGSTTTVRVGTYTYEQTGKAIATQRANGVDKYSFSRTAFNGTTGTATTTDPSNTARTTTYKLLFGATYPISSDQPGGSGCNAATSTQDYDANGNLAWRNDFNQHRTCYGYDMARNLETARVEGLASNADCTGTLAAGTLPSGSRKISTQWHPNLRVRVREAAPNKITTWVYNGQPDPTSGSSNPVTCAPATAVLPDGSPIAVLCRRVEQSTADATGVSGFAAAVSNGLSGNATPAVRTWSYQYNATGQVTSEDGPRTDVNDTVTYIYYPSTSFTGTAPNQVGHTKGDLAGTTNALGQATSYVSYDRAGNLLESVDSNEVVTRYTYDVRGRLHTRTEDADGSAPRTTIYDYDPRGLLNRVTFPAGTVSNGAGTGGTATARYVIYHYDDARRMTGMTTSSGDEVVYTLDNAGRTVAEEWHHANVAQPSKSPTTLMRREFDALGRLWKQILRINGIERTTVFGYDAQGNPTTTVRPAVGAETANPTETRYYNSLDQLNMIEDALQGITSVVPRAAGEPLTVLAPNLAKTTWIRDGFGQELKETSNDRGTTTQVFDAAGNLTSRTDARSVTATYGYDALNRLTGIVYSGTGVTNTAYNQAYVWDASASDAPFPCSHGVGRVCRIVLDDRTTWFAYDAFGNVSQQRDKVGSIVTDHQWFWDGENRLSGSTTTPPAGGARSVVIERDADGRARAVNATVKNAAGTAAQPIVKDTKYRADGVPERTQMGNDKVYQREFDDGGNIKGQQQSAAEPEPSYAVVTLVMPLVLPLRRTRGRAKAGKRARHIGTVLAMLGALMFAGLAHADETLEYDARGNIKTRVVDGQTSTYEVDELDRIKAETGKANQSFTYDANGNRTSTQPQGAAATTYTIKVNSNRITYRNGIAVVTDLAGNITQDQAVLNGATVTRNFTYNPANQLETVSINGVLVASYGYNHLNQRVRKQTYGSTPAVTIYNYDPQGNLIEEVDGLSGSPTLGQVRVRYVWKGDVPSAVVYAPGTSSNSGATDERIVYLETDHLNSPRKATDIGGGTAWTWTSDAFGSIEPAGLVTTINLRFPGQYADAETGMFYNYFRTYNPQTGRYVQSDPIGLAGGVNTYGYVGANPLSYADPMGLAPDIRVCVNGVCSPPPPPVWNPDDPRPAPPSLPDLTKPSPYLPTWNWDGITWPSWMESRRSDKERATDVPSWSKQYPRKPEENCAKYAERILNEHYGCDDPRAKDRGPGSEYSKIKKHCERGGK